MGQNCAEPAAQVDLLSNDLGSGTQGTLKVESLMTWRLAADVTRRLTVPERMKLGKERYYLPGPESNYFLL